LELAQQKGATVINRLVTDVRREGKLMSVHCADQFSDSYDLVVMATGVNSRLMETLENQTQEFHRPGRTKTFICEFHLGRKVIRETFGPSMHVFLLDIPRLEFAALIPKGNYVTLCLLGDDIDDELMAQFFGSPEVQRCFPDATIPSHVCHCYPRINIKPSNPAYGDRLVMVGDSGTTRLFKDGIGAAYRTAKAAAKTAVFHGVGAEDFKAYYAPLCRKINKDNQMGKVVFGFGGLVQKARFARRGVLRMTANEQARAGGQRRMSEVLWDLFSGSAPYTDVLLRTLHPAYVGSLLWNLVVGNMPGSTVRKEHARQEGSHDVRH
jgi:flavin-dependent dehydrogenase